MRGLFYCQFKFVQNFCINTFLMLLAGFSQPGARNFCFGKSSQNHLRVKSLNLRMLDEFGGSPTRYAQTRFALFQIHRALLSVM